MKENAKKWRGLAIEAISEDWGWQFGQEHWWICVQIHKLLVSSLAKFNIFSAQDAGWECSHFVLSLCLALDNDVYLNIDIFMVKKNFGLVMGYETLS